MRSERERKVEEEQIEARKKERKKGRKEEEQIRGKKERKGRRTRTKKGKVMRLLNARQTRHNVLPKLPAQLQLRLRLRLQGGGFVAHVTAATRKVVESVQLSNGEELKLSVGKLARLTDGAVAAQCGDTCIFTAVAKSGGDL